MRITLKTLPQATAQQVFDQAAEHLLRQGKKSLAIKDGKENCMYRSGKLSCAAGCLIADNEYLPTMEGMSWAGLTADKLVPSDHERLISELQFCHDQVDVERWSMKLKRIAEQNHLEWKFDTEEV